MADTKISALPSASTPLTGTEVLPIVQGAANFKVSVSDLTAGRAVSVASLTASGASVIEVTDTAAALRITQLGTGNALLVEDSANPDSSPVVITSNGTLIVGNTARVTSTSLIEAHSSAAIAGTPAIANYSWGTIATGGSFNLYKSRSGTVGTQALVAANTQSSVRFYFDDGVAFQQGASIIGAAEGTPALNSMPGRLTFNTTAAGSVTPTERMRIDSNGDITIASGTANGVTYLNGSKVLTSGTALTFDGTNLATTGGITGKRLDASFAGQATVFVTDTTGAASQFAISAQTGTPSWLGTTTNTALAFYTNSTEKMRLDTSGNLGLGVTPSAWTRGKNIEMGWAGNAVMSPTNASTALSQNAYFATSWKYGQSSIATALYEIGSGGHTWYNAPSGTAGAAITFTQAMTLDASGNLGIGTTSPTVKLHVVGTSIVGAAGTPGYTSYKSTGVPDGFDVGLLGGDASANGFIYNRNNGAVVFGTSGTEKMRLDASGNLGIGTTSPSVKLEVAGTSTTTLVKNTTTTAANGFNAVNTGGNFYFGIDSSTGTFYGGAYFRALYSDGAYPMVFYTNSAERMRLDASGNLGLGVTPSAWASDRRTYQVGRGGAFTSGTGAGFITLSSNAYYDGTSYRYIATDYSMLYAQTTGQHQWSTAASGTAGNAITFTQAMTLDASGNLGIGTTSPAAKLDVRGDSSSTTSMVGAYIYNGNSTLNSQSGVGFFNYDNFGAKIYSPRSSSPAGSLVFATNNGSGIAESNVIERMRLDASGNLGIGTTSPVSILEVKAANPTLTISASGTTGSANTVLFKTGFSGVNGDAYIAGINAELRISGSTVGGTNAFVTTYTSGTEKMRLDSSGNLLVGQTTSGPLNIMGVGIAPAATGGIDFNHVNGTGSGVLYARFNYNGTGIGSITQNGTTAVAYNTSSDYRLKNITGPITTSGAYIDSLKPVEGTWKADGSMFVGLIAHETQEVSRTTVATGIKDGDEMQGMDYSSAEIIANLIAELQSLRARVAQLESK